MLRMLPIGINTLLLMKSKKSRKSNPKIVILLHAPNPKDDGTASNRAMINIVIHAVPRFIWNLSIRTATSVSSSEMEEVSAASNTKIKNTAAITLEKAILSNTFGSIQTSKMDLLQAWMNLRLRIQTQLVRS